MSGVKQVCGTCNFFNGGVCLHWKGSNFRRDVKDTCELWKINEVGARQWLGVDDGSVAPSGFAELQERVRFLEHADKANQPAILNLTKAREEKPTWAERCREFLKRKERR